VTKSAFRLGGLGSATLLTGLLLGSGLAPTGLHAQEPGRGLRGSAELEAFLDGVMTVDLRDKHIAGAMVAVVKDGALVLAKGYGYADLARRIPVDPERTLFRPGSVSKLFTWTAVMQLVEQGKLDLGTDVNQYLDFKLPATYPEPITLKDLMTHSAGFEEDPRGLISEDSAAIQPMGEWLKARRPARVLPPGRFTAYSNYGTALAGYIVERVSGEPFADYVQHHILDPLGMEHTTAHQPLPAALAPDMSVGYEWRDGRFVAHSFEFLPGAAPAGVISASAADMAKFMIAHLQHGQLGDARILADSTSRRMQTHAFGGDSRLNGFALGFYEKSSHGLRIIGHGGDSQWFHTDLTLIPSENLGVYVSFNTNTGGQLTFRPFLEEFLDHYYPETLPAITAPAGFLATAGRFAGLYRSNRRSFTTYFKAFGLAGGTTVSVGDDTTLVMNEPEGTLRLVPIDSLLFREKNGDQRVAFSADASGRITHAFMGGDPTSVLDKQAWYEGTSLHLFLWALATLVSIGLVGGGIRRLFRSRTRGEPGVRMAGKWLVAAALAELAFMGAVVKLSGDLITLILNGNQTPILITLAFPVLLALFLLGALIVGFRQWNAPRVSTGARLRFTGTVVVLLLFLWSLNQWNLLGWKV
jgi:CubicO group peptidase (beta-lactamase class C family)